MKYSRSFHRITASAWFPNTIGIMASSVAILIITATVLCLLEVPSTTVHPVIRSLNWTDDFVGFFGVTSHLGTPQCLFMPGQNLFPSFILEASVLVISIVIISLRIVLMYTVDGLGHFQHFPLHYKYNRNPLSMFPGHNLPLQTWWRPLLHLSFWYQFMSPCWMVIPKFSP